MFKHRLSLKSMTYPIAVRSTSVSGSIARVSSFFRLISESFDCTFIERRTDKLIERRIDKLIDEAIELPEGSPEQECIDRLD
jgi:hypothetical protein